MKIVRTSYDRVEERRDRRYPTPPLHVAFDTGEYTTVNWSLGGFLLAGYARAAYVGQKILGTLRVGDDAGAIHFNGVVVRIGEPQPGNLAVQFTDLDERLVTLLDRTIARRLFRS